MAKLDAFDSDFNDAAAQQAVVTLDNVATAGKEADITRLTITHKNDAKAQSGLGRLLAGTGVAWKFCTYARAVAQDCLPTEKDKRGDVLHTQIATPSITLLAKADSKTLAGTLDSILKTVDQSDRQELLNRMLRMAAHDGQAAVVTELLAEGAEVRTQNCRALLNALIQDKLDAARVVHKAGADLETMLGEARALKYTEAQMKSLGTALCKIIDASSDAIDFYYVAGLGTTTSLNEKNAVREAAMAQFRGGDAAPLQEFYRGYMEFKRDGERQRNGNEGYTTHVIKPLVALMMESADPAATLNRAFNRLPLRDRQTAAGLVLRHLCSTGASPLMVDAAIDAGADTRQFGNLALSLAVRNGHTDLALHLVRQCGANIGEAVLDAQINAVKAEEMTKLYSFMAASTMPQVITATPLKIARKPS